MQAGESGTGHTQVSEVAKRMSKGICCSRQKDLNPSSEVSLKYFALIGWWLCSSLFRKNVEQKIRVSYRLSSSDMDFSLKTKKVYYTCGSHVYLGLCFGGGKWKGSQSQQLRWMKLPSTWLINIQVCIKELPISWI